MSDAGKPPPAKYVPPHLRNKNTGTAATSGTLMPMTSQSATDLRDWLNGLTTITAVLLGRFNGDDRMQLGERITISNMNRHVRYNVHPGGVLGSTWMEGVANVSINGQDNPRATTFLQLWQTATAPTAANTTTTTGTTGNASGSNHS
jgi:hypothetical protein